MLPCPGQSENSPPADQWVGIRLDEFSVTFVNQSRQVGVIVPPELCAQAAQWRGCRALSSKPSDGSKDAKDNEKE